MWALRYASPGSLEAQGKLFGTQRLYEEARIGIRDTLGDKIRAAGYRCQLRPIVQWSPGDSTKPAAVRLGRSSGRRGPGIPASEQTGEREQVHPRTLLSLSSFEISALCSEVESTPRLRAGQTGSGTPAPPPHIYDIPPHVITLNPAAELLGEPAPTPG